MSQLMPVGWRQLDVLMVLAGTLCAAGAGAVMPVFSIIFGDILDAFHSTNATKEVGAWPWAVTVDSELVTYRAFFLFVSNVLS